MHNLNLICIAAMLSCGSATRAFPQDKPAEKPAAATQGSAGPSSGARAEFLEEIAYYEQRYTRLAEAIPADKYAWRPGEGVRSIGEVYGHISAANYGIARALVTQVLKESFAHFRQAILAISDADMDKPQKMFNRQTTVRGAFVMITGHFGEHLGQSIAYARVNGITPPWTEETHSNKKQ